MTDIAGADKLREQELRIETLEEENKSHKKDIKEKNEDLRIMNMEKLDLLERNGLLQTEVRKLQKMESERSIMTVSAASELEQLRERAKRMDHEKMEIGKQRVKLEKFNELEAAYKKLRESNHILKQTQQKEASAYKAAIAAVETKLETMTLLCNEKNDMVERLQFILTTEQQRTAELEKIIKEMHETQHAIVENKVVDFKKEFPELGNNEKSLSLLHSLMESDDNDENYSPCIEESTLSNIVQSDKTFVKAEDDESHVPLQKPMVVLTDLQNMNESKSIPPTHGEVVSFNQQLAEIKPVLHPRRKPVNRKKILPQNASTPARPARADGTFVIETAESGSTRGLTSPVDSTGCPLGLDSAERRDRSLSNETKRVMKKDVIPLNEKSTEKNDKVDEEDIVKVDVCIPTTDDMPVQEEKENKPKPKRRGRKPKKVVEDTENNEEELAIGKTASRIPRPSSAVVSEAAKENVPEPATATKKKTKSATQAKRKTKATTTAAKAKASKKNDLKDSGVTMETDVATKDVVVHSASAESAVPESASCAESIASSEVSTSTAAGGDVVKNTKTSRAKSRKTTTKATPGRKTRAKRTYVKTDSAGGRAGGEASTSHAQLSTKEEEKTAGNAKENKRSVRASTATSETTKTRRVTRSQRK